MIDFGAGVLYATQTNDSTGAAVANATPVQFGALQDVSLDISFEEKLLYGAKQFPIAVGRGKGKISGKAKVAQFSGRMIGDLLLGGGSSAGIRAVVSDFPAEIPATPFQVTVAPPNSGTFSQDLGVTDADTGLALTKVATSPATGEYSVAAGVYTFAAADTLTNVLINYEYTATSTTARKGTLNNLLMGYAPAFGMVLTTSYLGKTLEFNFPQAMSTKLSLPFKNDDFMIPEFEFSVFANAAGVVGNWATSD